MSDATSHPLDSWMRKAGMYSTYATDQPLFQKLGLPIYESAPNGEWFTVGEAEVRYNDGEVYALVTVEAFCLPATFWRLTIRPTNPESPDKASILMKTGSGALVDYWPLAEMLARQMVTVEMGVFA